MRRLSNHRVLSESHHTDRSQLRCTNTLLTVFPESAQPDISTHSGTREVELVALIADELEFPAQLSVTRTLALWTSFTDQKSPLAF